MFGTAGWPASGIGWGQAGANPPAATGQAGSPAPDVATLQIFSRLTVVDVTVTDAKGKPVQDLKASDFTIKEDGKPQTLRSFQEIRENAVAAQRIPPKLPPDVYTNASSPQEAQGFEDFSCKSFQPRRIMPLIFGNRFRWEISQEINWRSGALPRSASRTAECTNQGSGDPDALS